MLSEQTIELIIGGTTLVGGLFLAYGPLRHRLPRFITRFARYSAALKLLFVAVVAGIALYHSVHAEHRALHWIFFAGVMLTAIGGAVFVLLRPAGVRRRPSDDHHGR